MLLTMSWLAEVVGVDDDDDEGERWVADERVSRVIIIHTLLLRTPKPMKESSRCIQKPRWW